jgi:hypothetical protein
VEDRKMSHKNREAYLKAEKISDKRFELYVDGEFHGTFSPETAGLLAMLWRQKGSSTALIPVEGK